MKKPNYSYEKRQREAAKEKKREAKKLKKQSGTQPGDNNDTEGNR